MGKGSYDLDATWTLLGRITIDYMDTTDGKKFHCTQYLRFRVGIAG